MDEQDPGQDASATSHVIKGFSAFFEKQKQTQWCVITAATMCGNFLGTAPLNSEPINRWTQEYVATKVFGSSSINKPCYPDAALNVTLSFSHNDTRSQDFGSVRADILKDLPVVFGYGSVYGNAHEPVVYDGHVIVLYGFDGVDNWYIADPWKDAVLENKPIDLPNLLNMGQMAWYTRKLRMS